MIAPIAAGTVVAGLGLIVGLKISGRFGGRQFAPIETDLAKKASVRVAGLELEDARRRYSSETGTYVTDLNELSCTCLEYQAKDSFPDGDVRRACKHITRVAADHFSEAPADIGWLYVCPPSSIPSWASENIAFEDIHVTEHGDMTIAVGTGETIDYLDVVVQDENAQLIRTQYGRDGTCLGEHQPEAHREILEALWLSGFVNMAS